MTEAYEDHKAYGVGLHNASAEEELSQVTKAVKINTLEEEIEGLTKELREARTISDQTKPIPLSPPFSNGSDVGIFKAKEPKTDPFVYSPFVISRLRNTQRAKPWKIHR